MTVERRIARVARQCARLVLELERQGELAGAARLRQAAKEVVENMRASAKE